MTDYSKNVGNQKFPTFFNQITIMSNLSIHFHKNNVCTHCFKIFNLTSQFYPCVSIFIPPYEISSESLAALTASSSVSAAARNPFG